MAGVCGARETEQQPVDTQTVRCINHDNFVSGVLEDSVDECL